MADTAAFFAKKKKKGKKKAFNANLVDIAAVTSNTHVDAPDVTERLAATSLDDGGANISGPASPSKAGGDAGEEWDDAKITKGGAIAVGAGATTELLDMKALQKKRNEEDDIAERMRVEETRAQLAAAKEGMAKQAERLKEAKEAKKNGTGGGAGAGPSAGGSRFGAAAASIGGGGGVSGAGGKSKWVPPHMRGAGSAIRGPASMPMGGGPGMGGSSRFGNVNTSGGPFQRQVDVADENLFPDLATADTIIQQQEEQQKKMKAAVAPKRKPAAGGSAWGAKPKAAATPAPAPTPKEEKKEEEPTKSAAAPAAPAPAAAPAASTAGPTPSSIKAAGGGLKKKKKKKDLSTFKPSS
mmetsp:Transcript_24868/g.71917  ORF Transcript_24868/g.71917 Transcript_24868/m.71917 type:complete len:354 (+) Transcript_24868:60-1121(+)